MAAMREPIGYIADRIPEFNLPLVRGSAYRQMVPDTFDLHERARMALHALTEVPDPEADYEIYFFTNFRHNPPSMQHNWHDALVQPKFVEAIALLRLITGSTENVDVEQKLMEYTLRNLSPDGLYYIPICGRPWSRLLAPYDVRPGMQGQFLSPFACGRALSAMTVLALRDPAGPWEKAVRGLADGLIRLAVEQDDFAFFWPSATSANRERPQPGQIPTGLENGESSRVPHGLVHAYQLTGYEPALKLAGKIIRYLRRYFFDKEGGFLTSPGDNRSAHFHEHSHALLAMADYAAVCNDQELLDCVCRSFNKALSYSNDLVGYFPEFINSPEWEGSELCEVADMIAVALKLSELGALDVWDMADRWIRNMFAEGQLTSVDWIEHLPYTLLTNPENVYMASSAIDDYSTQEKVAWRNLGAFAGWPAVNDLEESSYGAADKLMDRVKISSLSGLEDHAQLVEGSFLAAGSSGNADPVDVLVYERLAEQAGMQVGDVFSAQTQAGKDQPPVVIPVRVAGIWRERDPQDDYWYYGPNAVEKDLLVTESDLFEWVASRLGNRLYEVAWYWVLDGTRLQAAQVPTIIEHIERARAIATRLLPKATLEISPIQLLTEYQVSARSLGLYLSVFSLPLMCMILIFISQTASTWVGQRRNEIATLRSRGVSVLQIAGIAVLENLLLGLVGLAAAALLARGFVSLFCRATGFLQFSGQSTEIISTSQNGLQAGLAALGVIAAAQVIPTISAARYSVISYKRERSRQLSRPWWQRTWIDLLFLLPSGYGLYVLRQQGHLVPVDAGANPAGNFLPGLGASLFDPLLLLLPTLGIFALTLLLLRLLPYLMRAITWGCSRTSSLGLLMAVRSLARAPGDFHAPLILLVMTLSLSIFTASMAQTLDSHLRDMTEYLVGADMQLSTSTDQGSGSEYGVLPISEYRAIPGVQSAARVQGVDLSLQDVGGARPSVTWASTGLIFPASPSGALILPRSRWEP